MARKSFFMALIAVIALTAALIPLQVHAGGVCGGAYTVEKGDTVNSLAAMCGTSPAAIFAANPGLKEPLTAGQVITIPGANYGVPTTSVVASPTPLPPPTLIPPPPNQAVVNNYNTYNYYNYYNYYPSGTFSGTYVVQAGDTLSGIAYSYGLTIYDLMAANPYITDINTLYVGQIIYIPANYWADPVAPISNEEPKELSYYDGVPRNAPQGTVRLVNKTDGDVYISLRSNRADGTVAVNEYPVPKSFNTDIPVGWIDYVAWVGGIKFTGGFQLKEGSLHTITFNRSKVVVD